MPLDFLSVRTLEQYPRRWINRRGAVRYRCAPATAAKVSAMEVEPDRRAWILDLSCKGAGVLVEECLVSDRDVIVQITAPSGNEKLEFAARVAHATVQVNGEWLVGLEFLRTLSEDELDRLLY